MVEKVITPGPDKPGLNVVDFARYQIGRNAAPRAPAISARDCRYCGAVIPEGESEDECSSAANVPAPRLRRAPRTFYAD